jgi:glucose-6-phosphate isomerase
MSDSILKLNIAGITSGVVGDKHGINPAEIERMQPEVEQAHRALQDHRDSGRVGFFDLPYAAAGEIEKISAMGRELADNFQAYVNLGIGGSSLGGIAALGALQSQFRCESVGSGKEKGPLFYFPDNVDPERMAALGRVIDPEKTVFGVVSKSGGTAETAAQYLYFRDLLRKGLKNPASWKDHFVFITDESRGPLRKLADSAGCRSLVIPDNIGGRFSVLCPVGLLPMAVAGIDIRQVLAGAAQVAEACRAADLKQNPAYLLATLLYIAHREKGKPIHVLMAYGDSLFRIADWFRQLWAESLGKERDLDGQPANAGPTPIAALGATDQHSQVQLYMEGPQDKVVLLLGVEKFGEEAKIVHGEGDPPEYAYLAGNDFGELLNAERRGTEQALTGRSRPNISLTVPEMNGRTLGGLFYFFELVTAFAGELYRVNTYDQPGVELGKKYTHGLMGREGFEEFAREVEQQGNGDGSFILSI